MPTPVIAAKLFIPPPRPSAVARARLIARLNAGLHRRLTLISAPAGFGKTTLASAWIASCGRPAAWLSLDEADNDPTRFLTYLVAALQTIAPTVGAGLLAALHSAQPPPIEPLLTALLNELAALPGHVVLALDDYHLIDAEPVDHALIFLVEHLPPPLHLVIVTRADPPLPLARLRARDQLTELRAADLRFTPAEAAAFLNQAMGLHLSAADIAALDERTEGWIAGLQLAALSMQGHKDVPAFIQAFAGNHRYIVDYLVDEVLQRQPADVRDFLLQTCILDRLSGPLCDAVTGQESGSARLEALERGNLFVVPLDNQRHWYRYHHLFAEVLAAYLSAEQPDQVALLHRRASAWYAQHGSAADAIRHALAARDFARAASLIEQAMPALRQSRQEATFLDWIAALPDAIIQGRPVLSTMYAGALLGSGKLQDVELRLRDAERRLERAAEQPARPGAASSEMDAADAAELRRLPGWIAMYRAAHALALGDLAATVAYAGRVLDLVPADDHLRRGAATALLGLAAWTSGDLAAAHRSYADGMAHVQMAGNIADAIGGTLALADIRIVQGRLREATRIYARGLQLAAEQGTPAMRGTADMYVGMSVLHGEQNNLSAATQHLQTSQEQGEHTGFPQHPYRWRVAMAHLREAQGDLDGALDLLDEAERWYVSDFFPNVRPVAALRARLWVAQGRLAEALGWAQEQGLSAHDDLSYLHEFAHITLARALLACATRDRADHAMREAVGLLERLLQAAEAGERTGSVIEILALLALAQQAQGDIPAARMALHQALALAEPEGYIRLFVGEGPPMAALLEGIQAQGGRMQDYAAWLLAAFPDDARMTRWQGDKARAVPDQAVTLSPPHPVTPALIEPLSERERDVLRLLRTDLSGPDIARELIVSLSTMRTHTRNIYAKLGVTSRRAAVRRAAELELF